MVCTAITGGIFPIEAEAEDALYVELPTVTVAVAIGLGICEMMRVRSVDIFMILTNSPSLDLESL